MQPVTDGCAGPAAAVPQAACGGPDAAAVAERAQALGEGGAHAEALALLDGALALHPAAAALHTARGWALENLRPPRPAEARAAYERALALDAGQLWARLGLAGVLAQLGLEALCAPIHEALLRDAAARAPGEPEYRELIGWCLYRLGRLDEAAAAFEQALAVDAEWVSVHLDLALVRLLLGDDAGAARHAGAALDSLSRGDPARRAGPLAVALDDLDDALRRHPPAAGDAATRLRRRLAQALDAAADHRHG